MQLFTSSITFSSSSIRLSPRRAYRFPSQMDGGILLLLTPKGKNTQGISEGLDSNLFATHRRWISINFPNVSKSGRGHFKHGSRHTRIGRIWSVISRSLCSRGVTDR